MADSYGLFDPGSCCCNKCVIFADNFNRADSGSLGPNWSQLAATWSIASNKLTTSNASAIAECVVPPPYHFLGTPFTTYAQAVVSGGYARVMLSAGPAGGGVVFIAAELGGGKIRLIARNDAMWPLLGDIVIRECSAGSSGLLRICVSLRDDYIVTCWLDGVPLISAYISNGGILGTSYPDFVNTLSCGAVGTGASSGSVTFDDFESGISNDYPISSTVICPPCSGCCWPPTSDRPPQIKAVLALTTTPGGPPCPGFCESLNGTYLLDLSPDPYPTLDGPNCTYYYQLPTPVNCGPGPFFAVARSVAIFIGAASRDGPGGLGNCNVTFLINGAGAGDPRASLDGSIGTWFLDMAPTDGCGSTLVLAAANDAVCLGGTVTLSLP